MCFDGRMVGRLTVAILPVGGTAVPAAPAGPAAAACAAPRPPAALRVLGRAVGDMDGDGRAEQVSLRADDRLPFRCRYVLVAAAPTSRRSGSSGRRGTGSGGCTSALALPSRLTPSRTAPPSRTA